MLSSRLSLASMLATVAGATAASALTPAVLVGSVPRKTTKKINFSYGYGRATRQVSRDNNRDRELLTERYKAVEKYNKEVYGNTYLTRTGRSTGVKIFKS